MRSRHARLLLVGVAGCSLTSLDGFSTGRPVDPNDAGGDDDRASVIPATIARIHDRKGTLEIGKDADIVLLETRPRLEVKKTIVGGEVVYANRDGVAP